MGFWRRRCASNPKNKFPFGMCQAIEAHSYALSFVRFPLCLYDHGKLGGASSALIHCLEHLRVWPRLSMWGVAHGYIWADYDGGPMYFRWPAGGDFRKSKHLQRGAA